MTIGTRQFSRSASFTRPADTTQYGAGDAVSDNATTATIASFTLTGMAPASGMGGKIMSVVLHKSDQDLTGADFDIYFFNAAPVGTGFEDNAALAITDAEWQSCVGRVALTASANGVSVVTGDTFTANNIGLAYECVAGSTSLYYVIVARGTYTPASGEIITLRVGCEVN